MSVILCSLFISILTFRSEFFHILDIKVLNNILLFSDIVSYILFKIFSIFVLTSTYVFITKF